MNICANCNHHLKDDTEITFYDRNLCKTEFYIGRISGRKIYKRCIDVRNSKDDCPLYEEKPTLLERVINFFKNKAI